MNLSAIKAQTGAGKYCTVLNAPDGKQWISNGFAAWLVEDVWIENEAAIASLFNLTEKQIERARIIIRDTDSVRFTEAASADEEEVEELGAIYSGGNLYIALSSEAGAIWINAEYLKPVRDDYRRYYVRWHDDGGDPIIAVYDDLMTCKALVLPMSPTGAEALRMGAGKLCAPVAEWVVDRTEDENLTGGADEGGQERAPEQIEIQMKAEVDG